jgi:hypothetical protein
MERTIVIFCYNRDQRTVAAEIVRFLKKKKIAVRSNYMTDKEAKDYGSSSSRYYVDIVNEHTSLPIEDIEAIQDKYGLHLEWYDDDYKGK